ncbi:hypothetical protein BSKO_09106 [Bryopsis sp. KO-2023]|nr:hypothetical protein BSKO_09106 [Bryopsis sp. KO-2023]
MNKNHGLNGTKRARADTDALERMRTVINDLRSHNPDPGQTLRVFYQAFCSTPDQITVRNRCHLSCQNRFDEELYNPVKRGARRKANTESKPVTKPPLPLHRSVPFSVGDREPSDAARDPFSIDEPIPQRKPNTFDERTSAAIESDHLVVIESDSPFGDNEDVVGMGQQPLAIFEGPIQEGETEFSTVVQERSQGQVLSRWVNPDGTLEWKTCHVLAASEDGLFVLIEWESNGRHKWVSRFNVLFEGENEIDIIERREKSEQRRRLVEMSAIREYNIEKLPLDRTHLPPATRTKIMSRIGNLALSGNDSLLDATKTFGRKRTNFATLPSVCRPRRNAIVQAPTGLIEKTTGWKLLSGGVWGRVFGAPCTSMVEFLLDEAQDDLAKANNAMHFDWATACGGARNHVVLNIRLKDVLNRNGNRICNQLVNVAMDAAETEAKAHSACGVSQGLYQRLVSLTNVMLRDSVRSLVMSASTFYVQKFTEFLQEKDTSLQKNTNHLFSVKLVITKGSVRFSPSLSAFSENVLAAVERNFRLLSDIPNLIIAPVLRHDLDEPPFIVSLDDSQQESDLCSWDQKELDSAIGQLKQFITKGQKEMDAFLQSVRAYEHLLIPASPTLVEQMMAHKQAFLEDWEDAINKFKEEEETIMQWLCQDVNVNIYSIDCNLVSRLLIEGAHQHRQALLAFLSKSTLDCCKEVQHELDKIMFEAQKPASGLEDVFELRDTLKAAPGKVEQNRANLESVQARLDVLQQFHWTLSDEDAAVAWGALGSPTATLAAAEERVERIPQEIEQCCDELRDDRTAFFSEIENLSMQVSLWSELCTEESAEMMLEGVRNLTARLHSCDFEKDAEGTAQRINKLEALIEWEITDFGNVKVLCSTLSPFLDLWTVVSEFQHNYNSWMYGSIFEFSMEHLETSLPVWQKTIDRLEQNLSGGPYRLACDFKKRIDEFAKCVPLLSCLRTSGMRRRHWSIIFQENSLPEDTDRSQWTLDALLNAGFLEHFDKIAEIADLACKEMAIENVIDTVEKEFKEMGLCMVDHAASGTRILANGPKLLEFLDDGQLKIRNLTTSPNIGPHKKRVFECDSCISDTRRVVSGMCEVQAKWMALAPFFSGDNVLKELPVEGRNFAIIDTSWRHLIADFGPHPKLIDICQKIILVPRFQDLSHRLDEVRLRMSDFLMTRRRTFPRFYFLSDNELLNLLVQAKIGVQEIQSLLQALFPGICRLQLVAQRYDGRSAEFATSGFWSDHGEFLPTMDALRLQKGDEVEVWMKGIESSMRASMKASIQSALGGEGSMPLIEWFRSAPAQVIAVASNIVWSLEVTRALRILSNGPEMVRTSSESPSVISNGDSSVGINDGDAENNDSVSPNAVHPLGKILQKLTVELDSLIGMLMSSTTGPDQRKKLCWMILVKAQNRDFSEQLLASGATSPESFDWIKRPSYHMEKGAVFLRCLDMKLPYGYEFLGKIPQFVATCATDRALLALMKAVHLHRGGALEGQTGTGKTEIVSEMSLMVARRCVMFNCSEEMATSVLKPLLLGLVTTGAWVCLEEFWRLNVAMMSAMSKQILAIQGALRLGERRVTLYNTQVDLAPELAVFVSLKQRSTASRSYMPSNLRVLFRRVVLASPDLWTIAKKTLYALGMKDSAELATTIVSALKSSLYQLSDHNHYDFGIRAIRNILRRVELLKWHSTSPVEGDFPICKEALLRTIVPQLSAEDASLFETIVEEAFSSFMNVPQRPVDSYTDLLKSLKDKTSELNLTPSADILKRARDLYEATLASTGVVLLGAPASGKSCTLHLLREVLARQDGLQCIEIFPKALSRQNLFGYFAGPDCRWTDGLLTKYLRCISYDDGDPHTTVPVSTSPASSSEKHHERSASTKWIVMDGPMDSTWMDDLGGLLDTSRTLCLPNGERIRMGEKINVIFEVDTVSCCSPAGLSRCQPVYFSSGQDNWKSLVKAWVTKLPQNLVFLRKKLNVMANTYLSNALEFVDGVKKEHSEMLPSTNESLTAAFITLCNVFLDDLDTRVQTPTSDGNQEPRTPRDRSIGIEGSVLFSLIWALGPMVPLPDDGSVFDFFFDISSNQWKHFDTVTDCVFVPNGTWSSPPEEIFIPTTAFTAAALVANQALRGNTNVALVGPAGAGKSALARRMLISKNFCTGSSEFPFTAPHSDRSSIHAIQLALSRCMDPARAQRSVEASLTRWRECAYGPPLSKQTVLVVEDVHSGPCDQFGTCSTVELFRQWMEMGGWYSLDNLRFLKVVSMKIVCCIRNGYEQRNLSGRFLRHHQVVTLLENDENALKKIFSELLSQKLQSSSHVLPAKLECVEATIKTLQSLEKRIAASPQRRQYVFNTTHMAQVFYGLLKCTPAFQSKRDLVEAWRHECCRVFLDRIVEDGNRQYFLEDLQQVVCKHITGVQDLQPIKGIEVDWCLSEGAMLASIAPSSERQQTRNPSAASQKTPMDSRLAKSMKDRQSENEGNASTWQQYAPAPQILEAPSQEEQGEAPSVDFNSLFSNVNTARRRMSRKAHSVVHLSTKQKAGNSAQQASRKKFFEHHVQRISEVEPNSRLGKVTVMRSSVMNLAKICRALNRPPGHVLALGPIGVGKSTLSELAATILGFKVHTVMFGYHDDHKSWRDVIRSTIREAADIARESLISGLEVMNALLVAGVMDQQGAIVVRGSSTICDVFVDDLVQLMGTGLVPEISNDLFEQDFGTIEQAACSHGLDFSDVDLSGCRKNIRVILCMEWNDGHDASAEWVMKWATILDKATVLNISDWEDMDRIEITKQHLSKPTPLQVAPQQSASINVACALMHKVALKAAETHNYNSSSIVVRVSSGHFFAFLRCIRKTLDTKRTQLMAEHERYTNGVNSMLALQKEIKALQDHLEGLQPQIEETTKKTQDLCDEIEKRQTEADKALQAISLDEARARAEAEEQAKQRDLCDNELAKAMPPLRKALKELRRINKKDIAELKSLKNPPSGVKLVMRCICIMMERTPSEAKEGRKMNEEKEVKVWWDESIKLMSDFHFLDSMLEFDKNSMSMTMIDQLRRFTQMSEFSPKAMTKVSKAAGSMCRWVLAMDLYHKTQTVMEPKRQALALAQAELERSEQELKAAREKLDAILGSVKDLRLQYQNAIDKTAQLHSESEEGIRKAAKAQKVLSALMKESGRWEERAGYFESKINNVLGDVLISSAHVAYSGALSFKSRQECESGWIEVLGQGKKFRSEDEKSTLGHDSVNNSHWGADSTGGSAHVVSPTTPTHSTSGKADGKLSGTNNYGRRSSIPTAPLAKGLHNSGVGVRNGASNGDSDESMGNLKAPLFGSQFMPLYVSLMEAMERLPLHVRRDITLPTVAAVGPQSAGKTSVVESLVGRDFLPRGKDICTKRPLVLDLVRISDGLDYAEFRHIPETKFYDFGEVREEIETETERETGVGGLRVSSKPIHLKIYSPNVFPLRLVDLPGITKVAIGDQPKEIEALTVEMIMRYIEAKNVIILAVIAAPNDVTTSDALNIAREVDPNGERTLGVLTKLDLMDDGTDVCGYLLGEKEPKLRLGYVGVVNRSQRETEKKVNVNDHLSKEQKWFLNDPKAKPYRAIGGVCCGTRLLGTMLSAVFLTKIEESLSETRALLKKAMTSAESLKYELRQKMDNWDPSKDEHRSAIMTHILKAYEGAIDDMIRGNTCCSMQRLSTAAMLRRQLNSDFKREVADIAQAATEYSDEQLLMEIQNSNGVEGQVVVQDKPFKKLVPPAVNKMGDVCLSWPLKVAEDLRKIAQEAMAGVSLLQSFPKLIPVLADLFDEVLKRRVEQTRDHIQHHLNAEKADIDTDHESFIGGAEAARAAGEHVKSRKDGREGNMTPRQGSPDSATDHRISCEYFGGATLEVSINSRLSDMELHHVEMTRILLKSYCKEVVCNSLVHAVRQTIMHDLVKDELQRELGEALQKLNSSKFRDLLEEDPEWKRKRQEQDKVVEDCRRALNCLDVGIACSPDYELKACLSDESTIENWMDAGLPNNPMSIDNAIIAQETDQCVLLIDPQEKAVEWLKNTFKKRKVNLEVISSFHAESEAILSRAIENGATVLVENIREDVGSLIAEIVASGRHSDKDGKANVRLGEGNLEVHPDFRLYLATNSKCPSFPEDLLCHLAAVDFSIKESQLTEQLVSVTIQFDMPEIQKDFKSLSKQKVHNVNKLKSIEHSMLEIVNTTDAANTLETEDVYNVFTDSQKAANDIKCRNRSILANQARIGGIRRTYEEKLASKVAPLFFTLETLTALNYSYQFSLQWFLEVYTSSLKNAPRSQILNERLSMVFKFFVVTLYQRVCRSLLVEDQRACAVLLMIRLLQSEEKISPQELTIILHGTAMPSQPGILNAGPQKVVTRNAPLLAQDPPASLPSSKQAERVADAPGEKHVSICAQAQSTETSMVVPQGTKLKRKMSRSYHLFSFVEGGDRSKPEWLDAQSWTSLKELESLPRFRDIPITKSITENSKAWKEYHSDLHSSEAPAEWWPALTGWQRLLFQRCFKSSAIVNAAITAAEETMGPKCSQTSTINIDEAYEASWHESCAAVPLIFIASDREDPATIIKMLASRKKRRVVLLAMGDGEGDAVEKQIRGYVGQPRWLVLENCHLAGKWMEALQRIVENLPSMSPHAGFRLWLTIAAHHDDDHIPSSIFHASMRIVHPGAMSLKASLQQTLEHLSPNEPPLSLSLRLNRQSHEGARKSPWMRLTMVLCYLHSITTQRRHYHRIGWNGEPPVDATDLVASLEQLTSLQNEAHAPLEIYRCLIVECIYGSQLESEWDRRLLWEIADACLDDDHAALNSGYAPSMRELFNCTSLDGVMEVLGKLGDDLISEGAALGLHRNTCIIRQQRQAKNLLSALKKIFYPKRVKPQHERWSKAKTSIFDLMDMVPKAVLEPREMDALEREIALDSASQSAFRAPPEATRMKSDLEKEVPIEPCFQDPVATVLRKEIARSQKTINTIHEDLRDALLLLQGTGNLSNGLGEVLDSITSSQVPRRWCLFEGVLPEENLSGWVGRQKTRLAFLRSWATVGAPLVMPLGLLLRPEAYLHAVLQVHAWETQTNAASLDFDCEVLNVSMENGSGANKETMNGATELSPPEYGWYICGLAIQGAAWEGKEGTLKDSDDSSVFSAMPVVWLKPVEKNSNLNKELDDRVVCPVYPSASLCLERDAGYDGEAIFSLPLPCGQHSKAYWILRNVVLIACSAFADCLKSRSSG